MKNTWLIFFLVLSYCFNSYSQTYTIPWAQQQPVWVFPLWFENGNGAKDTVYFCYDPDANNITLGPDSAFGELKIFQDTSEFFCATENFDLNYDSIFLKCLVFTGLGSGMLQFNKGDLPLKIKWDRNLFYDSTLLDIPVPNTLPDPLFEIKVWCSDFDFSYQNCPTDFPLFWIPEDNINCCPDVFSLGEKTNSMVWQGDTTGPNSIMQTDLSLVFDWYLPWVGINEVVSSRNFIVYPNPSEGIFTVEGNSAEISLIVLSDLFGKQVAAYSFNKKLEISVEGFANGMYLLKAVSENGELVDVKKVVKE